MFTGGCCSTWFINDLIFLGIKCKICPYDCSSLTAPFLLLYLFVDESFDTFHHVPWHYILNFNLVITLFSSEKGNQNWSAKLTPTNTQRTAISLKIMFFKPPCLSTWGGLWWSVHPWVHCKQDSSTVLIFQNLKDIRSQEIPLKSP